MKNNYVHHSEVQKELNCLKVINDFLSFDVKIQIDNTCVKRILSLLQYFITQVLDNVSIFPLV